MDQTNLLKEIILDNKLIQGVLSNLRTKSEDNFSKVDLKPVLIKEELKYHFSYYYTDKVTHKNLDPNETINEIEYLLANIFKQAMIFTKEADYQILISKKGKANILKKKPTKKTIDLSHDRKKKYIGKSSWFSGQQERQSFVEFLIQLGSGCRYIGSPI